MKSRLADFPPTGYIRTHVGSVVETVYGAHCPNPHAFVHGVPAVCREGGRQALSGGHLHPLCVK
ncbi:MULTISPECIES: hypothetical protein [Pandoraea]|uniref:hypothetical protein n=1 Tax=Pandoraea TaxID=93217 RepID=UPI001F5D972E|nr:MULTISPECIES: hypothetical protein [Pandoraea]